VTAAGPGETPGADDAALAAFRGVDTWIFDLDDTLYPPHFDLFAQVDVRIRSYVGDLLGLGPEEARAVQKDYWRRYGTTLRGLIVEHGIDPDTFLSFVHDIDRSVLPANPRLAAAIARLPGRRFIMTNGSRDHAEKVAARLGIAEHFDDIFDIVDAGHLPKPIAETYDRFWTRHGIDPTSAAMFEDLARNLEVPHARGMVTVLVAPKGVAPALAESWPQDWPPAHVHHATDDLAGFLERVLSLRP